MTYNTAHQRAVRDAELIRRISGGDAAALRDLMEAYFAWLTRAVIPVVHSQDLAEDVVQDVFIRVWEIRERLDVRGSVAAYLYRAVQNRARDVLVHERSQRNIEARIHEEHESAEPRVENMGESAVASADFQKTFDTALEVLQPRPREIFLMRAQQDMSYSEIADALGINVATVRKQMYRAIKDLGNQLGMRLPDPE